MNEWSFTATVEPVTQITSYATKVTICRNGGGCGDDTQNKQSSS